MSRSVGTTSRGIRCPIIKEGDDLSTICVDSVLEACKNEGFSLKDRDVVALTESIVARAQGNYATIDSIAKDIKNKFDTDHIAIIFPILSRNRFAILLKGIARGVKKVTLMLSYPSDEVGNALSLEIFATSWSTSNNKFSTTIKSFESLRCKFGIFIIA